MKPYVHFIIPPELSEKEVTSWSRKEAQSYLEWLLGEMDGRICILLTYFECEDEDFDSVDLSTLGIKLVNAIRTDMFSNGDKLSDFGYAIAADAGLLVAKKLIKHSDRLHWRVEKGPKTGYSYNRPVLYGFGNMPLDPVGGMIGELRGVLVGDRDESFLTTLYNFWHARSTSDKHS